MTDTSENQEGFPLKIVNPKLNPIVKFCKEHKFLDCNRNRDFTKTIVIIIIISYLISLFSRCLIPKSTWSWWTLSFGLLISFIASDMISIGPGKLGSIVVRGFDSLIGAGDVYASDEIKYGNEILRIGFACQLVGLIFSLIDP